MRWMSGWQGYKPTLSLNASPRQAEVVQPGRHIWTMGYGPEAKRVVRTGDLTLLVIGRCLATDTELQQGLAAAMVGDWEALTAWPGCYAVVVSQPNQTVVIGDLAGRFRIYYAPAGHGYLWSTAATPLAAYLGLEPSMEHLAFELSVCGTERYGQGTPFEGISAVPAGSWLQLGAGPPVVRSWYKPLELPQRDVVKHFRETLLTAVERRMEQATTPPVMDFSGGIDSTTLAVLASRHGPVNGVTYQDQWCHHNDMMYARRVAAVCPGITHHEITNRPDELPYGQLEAEELFVSDLPSADLGTTTHIRATLRLIKQLGSDCHWSGDMGDAVLDGHPTNLADLWQTGRRIEAVRQATALARASKCSPRQMVAAMIRLAHTSHPQALARTADQLGDMSPTQPLPELIMSWYQLDQPARWLTPGAVRGVREMLLELVEQAPIYHTPGQQQDWQAIRHLSAHESAAAGLMRQAGVRAETPYFDSQVIRSALSLPGYVRMPPQHFKPLVTVGLADLLPRELTSRFTKDSFGPTIQQGIHRNAAALRRLYQSSRLVQSGVLQASAVADDIEATIEGSRRTTLGSFVATEIWLHQLDLRRDSWWRHTTI